MSDGLAAVGVVGQEELPHSEVIAGRPVLGLGFPGVVLSH